MNYKIERQIPGSKAWYEVILSPFETKQQAMDYYIKYNMYYPQDHATYKITSILDNKTIILKR